MKETKLLFGSPQSRSSSCGLDDAQARRRAKPREIRRGVGVTIATGRRNPNASKGLFGFGPPHRFQFISLLNRDKTDIAPETLPMVRVILSGVQCLDFQMETDSERIGVTALYRCQSWFWVGQRNWRPPV